MLAYSKQLAFLRRPHHHCSRIDRLKLTCNGIRSNSIQLILSHHHQHGAACGGCSEMMIIVPLGLHALDRRKKKTSGNGPGLTVICAWNCTSRLTTRGSARSFPPRVRCDTLALSLHIHTYRRLTRKQEQSKKVVVRASLEVRFIAGRGTPPAGSHYFIG